MKKTRKWGFLITDDYERPDDQVWRFHIFIGIRSTEKVYKGWGFLRCCFNFLFSASTYTNVLRLRK